MCANVSFTISKAPGKQWIFPERGKTTADFISPLPPPSLHRLQHITFIGLERSLTVKRLWQNPHVSLVQNVAKLGRLPQHKCRHTHRQGESTPHCVPLFSPADVKELMTKQQ